MAQPLPIHSWKLILPCDVSAVKFGASSFIRNISSSPGVVHTRAGRLATLLAVFQVANILVGQIFQFDVWPNASYASHAIDTKFATGTAGDSPHAVRRPVGALYVPPMAWSEKFLFAGGQEPLGLNCGPR